MNDFEDDDDEDEDEEDVTEGECTLHWLSMYGQPLPTVKLISSENVVDFLIETEDAILFYKIYFKKIALLQYFLLKALL